MDSPMLSIKDLDIIDTNYKLNYEHTHCNHENWQEL